MRYSEKNRAFPGLPIACEQLQATRVQYRLRQVRRMFHPAALIGCRSGCGRGLDGSRARLSLRYSVGSRREVRAQDELALETAPFETAVCLGDLVEGDALRDARPDGASF